MTKEDFGIWYKNNKAFLISRAKCIITFVGKNYSEVEELISITVEWLLSNLDKLTEKEIEGFVFVTMRYKALEMFATPKKICCFENFNSFSIPDEEYSLELDNKKEQQIKTIIGRAETKMDLMILTAMMTGDTLYKKGLNKRHVEKSIKKLKGESVEIKQRGVTYKGVICLKNGKIEKLYPSISSVTLDGFERSSVNKICLSGKGTHKGYNWEYVKQEKV